VNVYLPQQKLPKRELAEASEGRSKTSDDIGGKARIAMMADILFLVVENLRRYLGSPPSQGSVLHLVYESAKSNNGMHPTADTAAVIYFRRFGVAGGV
jgi:hypothetical protein